MGVMVVFGSLTVETFRSEVGNVFWADTVPKPVKLKLIRLKEGVPTLREFRVPFSLIFATPRDTLLLEGLYNFKSESGREFRQIMMTPIQSHGQFQEYQVVYN
jgi:hypothetical protein